jgi:hypothetical protein
MWQETAGQKMWVTGVTTAGAVAVLGWVPAAHTEACASPAGNGCGQTIYDPNDAHLLQAGFRRDLGGLPASASGRDRVLRSRPLTRDREFNGTADSYRRGAQLDGQRGHYRITTRAGEVTHPVTWPRSKSRP